MKVVLVHGKYWNSWSADGLGYIAAYLRRYFRDVELKFFQGCFDDVCEIVYGSTDADIVAFSCTTPTFSYAVRLAKLIKQLNPKVHTVIGGYHASSVPQDCLIPGIDQVVVGEGEAAMLSIVEGNRQPIVIGRPMYFYELPWPDRDLIRNERNIEVAQRDTGMRITSFQSHRGCFAQCRFCLDGYLKVLYPQGKPPGRRTVHIRFRDVGDLLNEMEAVTDHYKLDYLKFNDPTWNVDADWCIDFAQEKIKRGFDKPYEVNFHGSIWTWEMVKWLAKSGCAQIAIGIESGSPRIQKQIGKGTSLDAIKRAVETAHHEGIKVRGYFILGMPEEGDSDIEATQKFAEELNLDVFGVSILCPYPGTQMYHEDPSRFKDVDWEQTDEYSNDFWSTKYLTNGDLKTWQKKLTERFKEKLSWHNRMLVAEGGA